MGNLAQLLSSIPLALFAFWASYQLFVNKDRMIPSVILFGVGIFFSTNTIVIIGSFIVSKL